MFVWPDGNHFEGKACFVKGDEYIQYDIAADRADPGYPQRSLGEIGRDYLKKV
jgi:hypothetical protein